MVQHLCQSEVLEFTRISLCHHNKKSLGCLRHSYALQWAETSFFNSSCQEGRKHMGYSGCSNGEVVSSINHKCRGGQGLLSWAVCVQQESTRTRPHLVVMSLHAGLVDLLQSVLGELDHLLHCVCRGLGTAAGKAIRKMSCLTHAKICWLKGCLVQISLVGCFPHHPLPTAGCKYLCALQTCPRLKWSQFQVKK